MKSLLDPNLWKTCPECDGSGEIHSHNPTCSLCGGRGKLTVTAHALWERLEKKRLTHNAEVEEILAYVKDRVWRDDFFRKRMVKEARAFVKELKKQTPFDCGSDGGWG